MAMFNTAWNNLGTEAAAQRTRDTIEFLLYGPERLPMEDRLTILIHQDGGHGMPGTLVSSDSLKPAHLWSNDVLDQIAGDGFATMQHKSQFLWEAKDQ